MAEVARHAAEVAPSTASAGGPLRASSTRSDTSSSRVARSTAREGSSGYTLDDDVYDEEAEYEGDEGEDDDDEGGTAHEGGGGGASADGGQELMNETTVKSGYLYKRGEKRKNWKKRWFVLRSAKLYYYKNEKEYQLLRFIDMTEVHTIAAVSLKKAEHCFGISTSKRQYYVRASNAKEMQSWVDALRDVREQVRQRSTITRDFASLDVGGGMGGASSGGEQPTPTAAATAAAASATSPHRGASTSSSPSLVPIDRAGASPSSKPAGASPISIMIPGKGLYTAPAQPRSTTGGTVISPLSYTSDSETGAPSGVEQFGLSYASSAGQSMASSPGRAGAPHHQIPAPSTAHHFDYSSAGTNSPQSHSGGDDGLDGQRKSRISRRASGFREASVGSSVGDDSAAPPTIALQRRNSSQHQQVQSSSEEEGEGDEWDEDEEADRAMPLPGAGPLGLGLAHAGHVGPAPTAQQPAQPVRQASQSDVSAGKPKVAPEFFKDSSKVIHQGYLMKQSSRRKHWRKRWFVLTGSTLSYTRSHMDGKAHRQIPLSSILDAIEYTSKKNSMQSAPLSPSLSSFGTSAALSFGRSPLLGGGGANKEGGDGFFGSQAPERRNTLTQGKSTTGPATSTTTAEVDANAATTAAAGPSSGAALSSGEGEGGASERKVTVAPRQPTAAAVRAEERQQGMSSSASTPAPKRKMENCFKIITPKRVFIVCAPTEEEELKWLSALQALLAHYHEGEKKDKDVEQQQPREVGAAATTTEAQQQAPQSANAPTAASTNVGTRVPPPSISLSKPKPSQSQDDAHNVETSAPQTTADDVKAT